MSNEVLFTILFCVAGFASGRLMASGSEDNRGGGLAVMFLAGTGYITYISFYESWFWPAFCLLNFWVVGFFGKDRLKLFLRRRVRPQAKQAVGQWTPKAVVDEEDHSKIGIGS